jgi:transcriptional regulator with XRE-family HTH domain
MSQQELAARAGLSQALVSYYESGRVAPSSSALERIAHVLDLSSALLQGEADFADQTRLNASSEVEPGRQAFLATLAVLPGQFAVIDRPAGVDGGDLAFAVDLRSHVFLVVLDAEGFGPQAAPLARIAAACAFGATITPGGGVPRAEDIVEVSVRFWRHLGMTANTASLCVLRFERETRRVGQCRLGMPAPFLRNGRLAQWTGKPEGPAGAFVADQELEKDALLLIATDGIAHMATKGERTLWDAPELRTMLSRARDPDDVVATIGQRMMKRWAGAQMDDQLAIAVQL